MEKSLTLFWQEIPDQKQSQDPLIIKLNPIRDEETPSVKKSSVDVLTDQKQSLPPSLKDNGAKISE